MMLSILICSLTSRATLLSRVMRQLNSQIAAGKRQSTVEVLPYIDGGELTVGAKRNALLDRAGGEWVCFIDDDDYVSDSYVQLITEAIEQHQPDCVGITGQILWKGTWCRFEHSLRYSTYATISGPVFIRPPNHLNPIRTRFSREIRFPEQNRGEDTAFAMALQNSGRLQREHFISDIVYFYVPSRAEDRETPRVG